MSATGFGFEILTLDTSNTNQER